MSSHCLPNPKRLRQIPSQFNWVDHRRVRDHYFEHGTCEAMALYLFLVTVADARGLSYYAQPNLMKQLKLGTVRFIQARSELMTLGLIAYEHPLYQVLALTPKQTTAKPEGASRPCETRKSNNEVNQSDAIKQ